MEGAARISGCVVLPAAIDIKRLEPDTVCHETTIVNLDVDVRGIPSHREAIEILLTELLPHDPGSNRQRIVTTSVRRRCAGPMLVQHVTPHLNMWRPPITHMQSIEHMFT